MTSKTLYTYIEITAKKKKKKMEVMRTPQRPTSGIFFTLEAPQRDAQLIGKLSRDVRHIKGHSEKSPSILCYSSFKQEYNRPGLVVEGTEPQVLPPFSVVRRKQYISLSERCLFRQDSQRIRKSQSRAVVWEEEVSCNGGHRGLAT